ncbi:MAG: DNA translocase FtsK 4TM domain-containing protein [Magnetococcales bacterium]|nr:DNA translocase FtsK 4TM domain-containing protein [Magnetococcales bacterium]
MPTKNKKQKQRGKTKRKPQKNTTKTNKSSNKFAIQPFLGGLLLFLTIFLATAIYSYSSNDPSLHQTGDGPIQNIGGAPGAYAAGFLIQNFGYSAVWAIIYSGVQSFFLLFKQFSNLIRVSQIVSLCFIAIILLFLSGMIPQENSSLPYGPGGIIGKLTADFMIGLFGYWGSIILMLSVGLPAFLVLFRLSIIGYIEQFDVHRNE